jgi:hypothetical protein
VRHNTLIGPCNSKRYVWGVTYETCHKGSRLSDLHHLGLVHRRGHFWYSDELQQQRGVTERMQISMVALILLRRMPLNLGPIEERCGPPKTVRKSCLESLQVYASASLLAS